MASVNKATLIGNLGRDPEVRFTSSGAAICNITLATTRSWKSKDSGEKMEETEWHKVVCYDRIAQNVGEHLSKGSSVYVEGRLKTRKWADKEGVDRYTTEIIADTVQFLGSRPASANSAPRAERGAPQAKQPAPAQAAKPATAAQPTDSMDDDIPF